MILRSITEKSAGKRHWQSPENALREPGSGSWVSRSRVAHTGHGSRVRGILGYEPSWVNRSSSEIHWDRRKSCLRLLDRLWFGGSFGFHTNGSWVLEPPGFSLSLSGLVVVGYGLAGNQLPLLSPSGLQLKDPPDPSFSLSLDLSVSLYLMLSISLSLSVSRLISLSLKLTISLSFSLCVFGWVEQRRRKKS
jgi:hypothetical protein